MNLPLPTTMVEPPRPTTGTTKTHGHNRNYHNPKQNRESERREERLGEVLSGMGERKRGWVTLGFSGLGVWVTTGEKQQKRKREDARVRTKGEKERATRERD